MIRIITLLFLVVLLLPASSAQADITLKTTLDFMMPENEEAKLISEGNWGLSGEVEFHLGGIPDFISWTAGLDWVDMLTEESLVWVPPGVWLTRQTDQAYFRLWFGPRLRSHKKVFLRPYAGAHIAITFYTYETWFLDYSGQPRLQIARDDEFALGYGIDGGIEIRTAPTWSLDLGAKWLGTFGEPRQLSFDSETIQPSYILYYVGVRFRIDEGL